MFCKKCGRKLNNGICINCDKQSEHKIVTKNNRNKLSVSMLFILGLISAFWMLGSIAMFTNSDELLSDRIGSGILFLVLAIIFIIPFFIILNKYLKNTKADRLANKTHKKLLQEEQMQLRYKEILEHKEKINTIEAENQAKEKYINTIKDQVFQQTEIKQHNVIESNTACSNSVEHGSQEKIDPAEILLLKIDSISTSGVYFENIACRLLESNGYENVRNTPASGDYGIDILAEKDGISYAIQCKCYSSNIGNKAVQEAFSGKQFYNCMVAVVFTNSHFTKSAIETAKSTNVLLWDREKLVQMINNTNQNDLKELTNADTL